MSVGDITVLENVGWDWFVSCTVAAREASDVYLKRKAWALLRGIARHQHVHFQYLPFALRLEAGVDPCHRHFHFLVGSLKRQSQNERFRTMDLWGRLLGSTPDRLRGTCRARLYDGSCGLESYLSKQLNAAEARGWMSGDAVILSHAAARIAFRNARMGGVRCNA